MSGRVPRVRVRLPAVLRGLAGGRGETFGEGRTVREVLQSLERVHPGLGDRLVDPAGTQRRYLSLFLNDEDVRSLSGLDTAVGQGDELMVVPAISGGAPARLAAAEHQVLQGRLPGFDEGRRRLFAARVRVAGAGKAAGPAILALSKAGVGRLWIDDPSGVLPADEGGWVPLGAGAGSSRADRVLAHLSSLGSAVLAERFPTGGVPTATLVCTQDPAEAREAAEQSRRAGIPHVVLEWAGEGGPVVTVPPGAPCYDCSQPYAAAWRSAQAPGPAASCLAALELVLAIAVPAEATGRRIELVDGLPVPRPTLRRAGCRCHPGSRR